MLAGKPFALAVAAVIAVAPRLAEACSPVPPRWPRLAEPLFEDSSIDIASERLDLDCKAHGRDLSCTLEIALEVRNVSASPVETTGAVLGGGVVEAVEVTSPVPVVVSPAEVERFFGGLQRHPYASTFLRRAFAFPLALGAGESRRIVVRTSFVMQRFVDPCFVDGVRARHPLLAVGRPRSSFELVYFHSNAGRKLGRDRIGVHVRQPMGLDVTIDTQRRWDDAPAEPEPVLVHRRPGEEEASVGVAHADSLDVGISAERSPVWAGGPFVGAGWWFAPRADRGPRLRLGYEFAAPVWLLHSIAMETDATRVFAVVPASEVVTRSQPMFPLVFGGGLGLPVRLGPDPRAGARVQASAGYANFTLRGGFDVYPALRSLPTVFEGWVGGQMSL